MALRAPVSTPATVVMSAVVYVYGPVPIAEVSTPPAIMTNLSKVPPEILRGAWIVPRSWQRKEPAWAPASGSVTTVVGYVSGPPAAIPSRSVKHSSIWSAVGWPAGTGVATWLKKYDL